MDGVRWIAPIVYGSTDTAGTRILLDLAQETSDARTGMVPPACAALRICASGARQTAPRLDEGAPSARLAFCGASAGDQRLQLQHGRRHEKSSHIAAGRVAPWQLRGGASG